MTTEKLTTEKLFDLIDEIAEMSDDQLDVVSGGIGSQSTGAGAGRVTFNPFSIIG